jgi:hypothetical protein
MNHSAAEDKCEVVVPVDAMASIDTFVQLFRLRAFCLIVWAKSSEYVTQVTAIGPLGLEYVSANDDPRKV